MTARGILFDKDGTLLDYHRTWMPINRDVAAYAASGDATLTGELLELAGYDASIDRVRSGAAFAVSSTADIAALFETHLGARAPNDLAAEMEHMFHEGGASSVLVDDCVSALDRLHRDGFVLGIATNDSEECLNASLNPHGILHLFDFLAGYDSGYGPKPDPGVALAFCAATGVEPRDAVMVGDNIHDIETGKRAGFGLNVGVLTGTSARADLEGEADVVLESIVDLGAVLIEKTFTNSSHSRLQ